MLDKSVPYAGLYMRRSAGAPLCACPLPEGFSFAFFKDGDESDWARIETSVLEFDSEFAALMYFKGKFTPDTDELYARCLFIVNADGEKVATATAWWDVVDGARLPWLHWVAVEPEYQGLGLGNALISRITELMVQLESDTDFYLHTQTWSYKAIGLYKKYGFEITDDKSLYKARPDNYKKAIRILKRLVKVGRSH